MPIRVASCGTRASTPSEIARKTALDLQAEGLRPYIFEGYRSFARQTELYNSGRGVTQVRAGGSWHNYGLAIDIIFYDSRGNPSWGAPMADWRRVGALGKANGATVWGGDWGWDNPHLEYHPDWTGSAYDLADIYNSQGITAVWIAWAHSGAERRVNPFTAGGKPRCGACGMDISPTPSSWCQARFGRRCHTWSRHFVAQCRDRCAGLLAAHSAASVAIPDLRRHS